MDFRLTNEQELLVETARALFADQCPSTLVRSVAADPDAARGLFDKHLRDWVELAGGPVVDLALFLVEAGAVVAPGPFLATAGLFAPLLAATGHELAEAAVAGEATGTVAVAGADRLSQWAGQPGRPDAPDVAGEPGTVSAWVIDAHLVDHVAVVLPGPALAVVPVTELELTPVATLDLARSTFAAVVPAGLEGAPIDPARVGDAVQRATVAVAAELVGVARWLVETSVAYARERVQFGRPIGSFQAIQHALVDMALAQEAAAAAVAYAAMCIDADDADRHRAVHIAKSQAGLAARQAARRGLQIHGGIGYTWEHDLHLRLRRAYADDALCGTHEWHLDRLAELLFGAAATSKHDTDVR